MIRNILLLVVVIVAFSPVCSFGMTGKKLKKYADSELDLDRGIFYGYITGVLDARKNEACLPQGVTNGQINTVVENYLRDHPDVWHFSADDIVIVAVQKSWPCQ